MKRHAITKKIMKCLYPDKRMSPQELNLNKKDLLKIKHDKEKYGGFNTTQNQGEIDLIWLSSNGKKYVESINYYRKFKHHIKLFFKWIANKIIDKLTNSIF